MSTGRVKVICSERCTRQAADVSCAPHQRAASPVNCAVRSNISLEDEFDLRGHVVETRDDIGNHQFECRVAVSEKCSVVVVVGA